MGKVDDHVELRQIQNAAEIEQAKQLFQEYAAWLGINLCFQGFEQELANLPGQYVPPRGRLYLALDGNEVAGCVALRDLGKGTSEMKRLFVRPNFRSKGIGHTLTERIIAEARLIGYERIRLDTLPGKMDRAIGMYRSFGFKEIAPYYDNPVPGATFMQLEL